MTDWDGSGVAVKRCCARCRTPYNCGNPRCACHAELPLTGHTFEPEPLKPSPSSVYPSAPVEGTESEK